MISQLHKDNNTAVEDQREKKPDVFIYNSLCCKHVIFTLLLTNNRAEEMTPRFYSYSAIAYYNRTWVCF